MSSVQLSVKTKRKVIKRLGQDFARNKYVYLMVIPVLVFYILFKYGPMTKMIIAFQDYNLYKGIAGSKWVGFENFIDFFQMKDCWRLLRNTLLLSLYSIVFAFPAPILLALMINEIKSRAGRKLVQTVSYMPHFISGRGVRHFAKLLRLHRYYQSNHSICKPLMGVAQSAGRAGILPHHSYFLIHLAGMRVGFHHLSGHAVHH